MNIYRYAFLESFVRRKSLDAQLNQFSASVIADCLSFVPIKTVMFQLQPLHYSFELKVIKVAVIKQLSVKMNYKMQSKIIILTCKC